MKVKNRLLMNYIAVFLITTVIAVISFLLLGTASLFLEDSLVKNKYTADSLMTDEISDIEYTEIVDKNGGIQIIDSEHRIIFSRGINTFPENSLTTSEFTRFLELSQSIDRKYSYSIAYNENKNFWLVVSFPTSLRIDFNITHNDLYNSSDTRSVIFYILTVIALYAFMLVISALIYSKVSASTFTHPLQKLQHHAQKIRSGDYSARADFKSDDEFMDLESSLNEMADNIQYEMALRKKSEETRRQLTLSIVHDLKNPLAVVSGYAQYLISHPDQVNEDYLKAIYQNSNRADSLLNSLFDLSKMESADYMLDIKSTDLCEYLRIRASDFISDFEASGFKYEIDIPEKEIFADIDEKEMDKVLNNLFENALIHNEAGTRITLKLCEYDRFIRIEIADDGKGIDPKLADQIFLPFIKADKSRNSSSGGSGLGLAIASKVIERHNGKITLESETGRGSRFFIDIPRAYSNP